MFVDKMMYWGLMNTDLVETIGFIFRNIDKYQLDDNKIIESYDKLKLWEGDFVWNAYQKIKKFDNVDIDDILEQLWRSSGLIPTFAKVMDVYLTLSRSRSEDELKDVSEKEIEETIDNSPVLYAVLYGMANVRKEYEVDYDEDILTSEHLLFYFKTEYEDFVDDFKKDPIQFIKNIRTNITPTLLMGYGVKLKFDPVDWLTEGC